MSVLFKVPDALFEPDLPIDTRVAMVSNYGQPQEEFLVEAIREYRDSKVFKDMRVAKNYFFNKNDICQRERFYIDRKGQPVKTTLLTNTQLSHPFMRKLVKK